MFHKLAAIALLAVVCPPGFAQTKPVQKESEPAKPAERAKVAEPATEAKPAKDAEQAKGAEPAERAEGTDHAPIREMLKAYLEEFNKQDAAAVAKHWATDGVCVSEENDEPTVGREAVLKRFTALFKENPGVRLTGEIERIHAIRSDVVTVDGRTTLFIPDEDPVESAFSAILVKDGDQWLISSSTERDLPKPTTAYDALKDLEWLVGSWEDQSDSVSVKTTVRWTKNQTFLLRAFTAQFGEEDEFEGTQVIGWDPANEQIRAWTFNSDGSFSEGTMSKSGDDWMLKLTQTLSDGKLSAATQVITRVDDDTITVQTVGQTVDGVPVPASDPVTVVRVPAAEDAPVTEAPATEAPATEAPATEKGSAK